MAKLRQSIKDKAKDALRMRIVHFKTEELMTDFIEDTIDEMWNIFEDSLIEETHNGI